MLARDEFLKKESKERERAGSDGRIAKKGEPIRLGSIEAPFSSQAETVNEVAWVTKGLRVRIVDEAGSFQESHLRKGRVRKIFGEGEVGPRRSGISATSNWRAKDRS